VISIENSKSDEDKKETQGSDSNVLKQCPSCGKLSLFRNTDSSRFVCTNPDCKQIYTESEFLAQKPEPLLVVIKEPLPVPIPDTKDKTISRPAKKKPILVWISIIIVAVALIAVIVVLVSHRTPPVDPTISGIKDNQITADAPIATLNPVYSSGSAPPSITKPQYLKFHNDLAGYSVDYPSSWKLVSYNGMHTTFSNISETVSADMMVQQGDYDTLLNAYSTANSGKTPKVINGHFSTITYSLFTQVLGTKMRHIYLTDRKHYVLNIDCDYKSGAEVEKNFEQVNEFVLNIISSFHTD
jgi:hypothetical protein